jgi:hypothetical protein
VSSDAQNIPYYGELDVELFSGENIQSNTVKDRAKQSTTKFYQFHTLYSFETGIRRIMSIHLTRRRLVDEHWQREPLAPILIYLLELWKEKQPSIKGVIGDSAYYNLELIEYLQERKLDYVIRADMTSVLQSWCEKEGLRDRLHDGECILVPDDRLLKQTLYLKQLVVKRNSELLCLVYPKYSKLKAEQIIMLFEERFAIESSYREIGGRRGLTTSISPQYRFAIFATAALIYNLLLSYQELVISSSRVPEKWKVTMLEIMAEFRKILEKYLKTATIIAKMKKNRS